MLHGSIWCHYSLFILYRTLDGDANVEMVIGIFFAALIDPKHFSCCVIICHNYIKYN